MDTQVRMSHVNHVYRAWYVYLKNVDCIWLKLTEDDVVTLVNALIASKLDNSICLLYGIPVKVIKICS